MAEADPHGTTHDAKIHHRAVAAAAALHWVLGAVWYTAFARPWSAGIGRTMAELARRASPVPYANALLGALVMSYALAWAIAKTGGTTAARGAVVGGLFWLGFVATSTGVEYGFEGRGVVLFAINAGYPLVGLLAAGALLGGWRRRAPSRAELATASSAPGVVASGA